MSIVPVDQIVAENRLRHVDAKQVDALASSIAEIGLLNPVTLYERAVGYGLVAGAHRLEAVRSLGLTEIEAHIVKLDDDDRIIAECDENLCSAALSPSDRARFTDERKRAYERKHPETKHGAIGGGHDQSCQVGDSAKADRFTADTSAKTGQSERTVQRDAERGEKVIPEVIDLIRGTKLDTGTYLDKLKRLPPNDQVVAAKRDLAFMREQERQKANGGIARRVVKVADQPLSDEEAAENQYASLVAAWNKAGETARQRFRDLIDSPVMDRSAA
jgi:ParB-like chromosome segregation protein Spo0J